jgi:hypothetical protein
MEYRFNAKEWDGLSSQQKIQRCRLLAAEANHLAKRAPDGLRESYLNIARDWLKLAEDIEKHAT